MVYRRRHGPVPPIMLTNREAGMVRSLLVQHYYLIRRIQNEYGRSDVEMESDLASIKSICDHLGGPLTPEETSSS